MKKSLYIQSMSNELTTRQHRIYSILMENRFPAPSLSEMAKDLGVVPSTIRYDLIDMEKKGWVERARGSRAVRALTPPSPEQAGEGTEYI
jgi:DeoR/GlpR family transcriptional regulator of sugar metabolism